MIEQQYFGQSTLFREFDGESLLYYPNNLLFSIACNPRSIKANKGEDERCILERIQRSFYPFGSPLLNNGRKLISDSCDFDFAILSIEDNFTMGSKVERNTTKTILTGEITGRHNDTFASIKID